MDSDHLTEVPAGVGMEGHYTIVHNIQMEEDDSGLTLQNVTDAEAGGLLTDEGEYVGMTEADQRNAKEAIRTQISTLCRTLSKLGEECFLLSLDVEANTCHHVGSDKGEQFCLQQPVTNMMKEFSEFCLGHNMSEIEFVKDEPGDMPTDVVPDILASPEQGIQQHFTTTVTPSEQGTTQQFTSTVTPPQQYTSAVTPPQQGVPQQYTSTVTQPIQEPPQLYTPSVKQQSPSSKENHATQTTVAPRVISIRRKDHSGIIVVEPSNIPATEKQSDNKTQDSVQEEGMGSKSGGDEEGQSEKENQKHNLNILFLCESCKDIFSSVTELRTHKKDVHGETDYVCDQCGRVFTNKLIYERHKTDAHLEGDDRLLCDTCIRLFKSENELAQHIADCHDSEQPMKCDVCEQMFADMPGLMDHRKIHFDYACFCSKCWQGFFDYLELETHMQHNCRYREALYKCAICGKKFTKLHLMSKHVDTHPVHSPHVCRMCGRGFSSEKELKNHRMAAHIIRPFKCELCEKTFRKREALVEHRRIHLRVKCPGGLSLEEYSNLANIDVRHGGDLSETMDEESVNISSKFQCQMCGIALATQSQLDQHIHQHEVAQEQFQCDHCDYVFFALGLLSLHNQKDHKMTKNMSNLDTVCQWEGCTKTFTDKAKLRQHMKYHEQRADKIARGIPLTQKKSSVTCEICHAELKYKSYLKAHMLNHQNGSHAVCEVCGESFPSTKKLADHRRTHMTEKPFQCTMCDKAFASNSLRKQHLLTHSGIKRYVCDVCGKGFMSRKHFHDHLRLHNGEQQYRCDSCGKEFIYFRSLVRHQQTHIDPKVREKPYKCEFCGKEYTEVTGYKHHMRSVHTGENPYQCDFCGESFHRNDKLKRHIKTRHCVNSSRQSLLVTTRRGQGAPVIVKAEAEQQGMFEIVHGDDDELGGGAQELHLDVVQQEPGSGQQVFLIGLPGTDNGETTYLQETQVIEGSDGVRYIIAGAGEELQVIESSQMQVTESPMETQELTEGVHDDGGENILIMNDGALISSSQETLTTLANMASVAEIAQQ
ncbi:zinc finger protein 624-like isoform X2 [Mya arenaria]|uniref:zinc finger protein 624-like isoform X2 n=1 Tax=Mya arenaria TaxID=6604 RepID=UPI0022E5E149|nr:zinc finger protein 624-like isoform X2 [Mya arenaria]